MLASQRRCAIGIAVSARPRVQKDCSGNVAFDEQDKGVKLLIMWACYHVGARCHAKASSLLVYFANNLGK
jgi:hypothetical protein